MAVPTSAFPQLTQEEKSQVDSLKQAIKLARNDTTIITAQLIWGDIIYQVDWDSSIVINKRIEQACLAYLQNNNAAANSKKAKFYRKSLGRAYQNLGMIYTRYRDHKRALNYNQRCLSLKEALGDTLGAAYAFASIGWNHFNLNNYDEALSHYLKSIDVHEKLARTSNVARVLTNIGRLYEEKGEYEKALEYFTQSKSIWEALGNKLAVGDTYLHIGSVFEIQDDLSQALGYYKKSREIYEDNKDTAMLASTLSSIGAIFNSKGDYTRAMEYYTKILEISEGSKVKARIYAFAKIGGIYGELGEHEKALEYFFESLRMYEELKDTSSIGWVYNVIGTNYEAQGEMEQALAYYEKSLAIRQKLDEKAGIAWSLSNIGGIYKERGDYDTALLGYTESLRLFEELGSKRGIAWVLHNIGRISLERGNYQEAIAYCERSYSLAKASYDIESMKFAANSLHEAYEAIGAHQKSLTMYKAFIAARDSIESEANQKATFEFEYDRKALADSLSYVRKKAETKAAFESEIRQRNYSIFVGIGLALLAFFLYRDRQQRKERAREVDLERQQVALERERAERLEQIDKLKDQFLANTSHELRTPLNGIIGITEGLFDQAEDDEVKLNLGMVVASGKRLASLVNDLLDFSRIKNADILLYQRPIDLKSVVDVVLQVSAPLTQGKDLKLENNIGEDLPAAFVDENRLTQVLYNLVGNSVKFTETGFVRVSAKEHDGMLQVAVSDTGTGIPEDKKSAIFEAFEQVDGSTERKFAGTGLGLSISKVLVEKHGGSMWVESTLGKGSTFFFTLPLSTQPAQISTDIGTTTRLTPLVLPETPQTEETVVPNRDEAIQILVVDDEPINHQVLKNHLREE
ncbi:MAG: tetratricopeptide repeat protein, partial [Bacteroidota bacterium]